MKIIIGEKSGFCAGVNYTVKKASELLNEYKKIYCLGEIVHNERVVKSLEEKGMITVNEIDEIPNGEKVIFRAHGEAKKVYEKAQEKNLEIFDLTCGKVKLIHNKIEKNNDSFVLIIGKGSHPETIGHYGYIDKGYVIENIDDVNKSFDEFKNSKKNKIYVVAQTTFNENKFEEIIEEINKVYKDIEVVVEKTICSATRERQEEVIKLAKEVDIMIIVGGKNSSNTKELYNLAINDCDKVYLVQDVSDLNDIDFKADNIGIMAGASTPNEVIEEIKAYIESNR